MTLKQAKQYLGSIGMSINTTRHGEYRINYKGGSESTAAYETTLDSAVETAIAMAAKPHGNPGRRHMARGYGAAALPAHYRRRGRSSRRLPPMAGHRIVRGGRHYRHNPGGTNWMPIVLVGAAAFFLLPRLTGGAPLFGGTSVTPPGYTYLGSGYYRGPDGQTYYRSPTTGQMAPSSAAAATGAMAQNAGYGLINTTIGSVTQGLTSLIRGVFSPGAWTGSTQPPLSDGSLVGGAVVPAPGSEVPTPDAPGAGYMGGASVGLTPDPLPDFQFT